MVEDWRHDPNFDVERVFTMKWQCAVVDNVGTGYEAVVDNVQLCSCGQCPVVDNVTVPRHEGCFSFTFD